MILAQLHGLMFGWRAQPLLNPNQNRPHEVLPLVNNKCYLVLNDYNLSTVQVPQEIGEWAVLMSHYRRNHHRIRLSTIYHNYMV